MNENTNITDIISAALAAGCQIDPTIPDAEAHTWAKLRQGFPDSALACLDRLIEHERNQQ